MRVVGLFPYIKRARVADVTLELIAVLESAGYEVLLEEEKALELGRKDLGLSPPGVTGPD